MNFVQNIEECLRDLAAASRQKHPGVKEACERAVMKLRQLQSQYVKDVRSRNTPTTSMFQNSEILHPFLLASNYPNANYQMLEVSFDAFRKLMEADAILYTDSIHMIRVYQIQAQVVLTHYCETQKKKKPADNKASSSGGSATGATTSSTTTSSSSSSPWLFSMGTSYISSKNSVSSSSGKSGERRLNDFQLEKLALEILSSLLQLMELIQDHDAQQETWINAIGLATLWEELPDSHKVKQAAHSTLSQILCLYFKHHHHATAWDDLLGLVHSKQQQQYSGLLQNAKPLPIDWSFELLTQVWNEPWEKKDVDILKTMGVLMKQLEQVVLSKTSTNTVLRMLQFTLVLFTSHGTSHPNECRELYQRIVKLIVIATDSCRQHHDFEDGYTYEDNHHHNSDHQEGEASSLSCLYPADILYKAGFVLEVTFHILNMKPINFLIEHDTVSNVAETLSDFLSIGTSCRDHILYAVQFCCKEQQQQNQKPTIFRKAEHNIQYDPKSIVGETMWLALQSILRIGECLPTQQHRQQELFQEVFSPSLAVLQHVLKRFAGCTELVELALSGYSTLASMCLPIQECAVERKVLLTSLSKLSLPSWGKHDTSCELQDHHIKTLLCLLRIVHLYYDYIDADWDIILWTFEQLSMLEIASPKLSETAYHASLAVSAVYQRFASFSTCFADDSVLKLVQSLSEICQSILAKRDVVGDSDTVLPERKMTADSKSSDDKEASSSGIGGKIMSMGVRAIYGNSASDLDYSHNKEDAAKSERAKKAYFQDYREDFVARLSPSSSAIRNNAIGRIPFVLVLLSDVVMANLFRSKACRDQILVTFSGLGGTSPAIRPFIMDMTSMLLMHKLSSGGDLPIAWHQRSKLVLDDPMQSQLLAVEPLETLNGKAQRRFSQIEALTPLCDTIRSTEKAEVAKSSLEVLNSMLEGTGQNLQGDVWPMVIGAIASLSGESSYRIDRSSSEWAPCCLSAFRSLKLIVDDFLEQLRDDTNSSSKSHEALLDCCSSFVGSHHDINTSLTAIGLLWTIADQDPDSSATDRALSKLAKLSSDDRPEVRNAAVNTLFSFIAGRGGNFTTEYWKSCVTKTIFGVYDIVAKQTGGASTAELSGTAKSKKSRYEVRLHHSSDSAGKMWIATQVLVLRGLSRVLRNFFNQMLDSVDFKPSNGKPWFRVAWSRILEIAFDAASLGAGRGNLDIRNIGIELLITCCQLSSKAGIQAALSPARVGTNMEVVNGALRSVRETQTQRTIEARNHSEVIEAARKELFLESFDALEAFEEVVQGMSSEDDSDLQILGKFCLNLTKLYECGQDNEFNADSSEQSLRMLAGATSSEHLVNRLIRIVVTVLKASAGDTKAKYLNQAQRASLDVLKMIAANGSPVAFDELISIAGPAFFLRKESDADESESGEFDVVKHSATLLNFEAASGVAIEIESEKVSDECRVFVLRSTLADFIREYDLSESRNKKLDARERRLYKRFVAVMRCGLESCTRLATSEIEGAVAASEDVWANLVRCLSIMLTPLSLGKTTLKIPRVSELVAIVSCAESNVIPACRFKLSAELSSGALKAYETAKKHAFNAGADPESDFGRKSKRHRDDLLKLFYACFSGSCALNPNEANLRSVAMSVLEGALSQSHDAVQELSTEGAIMICLAIDENKETDMPVAAIFSALCNILTSPNTSPKLKEAAGKVLTGTNIASTLQSAQERYEKAEMRAQEAEKRALDLAAAVEALQKEKLKLQQDLSTSERGRSSIWGL